MRTISPQDIAPPVAFVIVGPIMIIIAATGIVPIGNPQPVIAEPFVRIGLGVLGAVLTLLSPVFVWRQITGPESTDDQVAKKVSKRLAVDISTQLKQDINWASEALDRAKIGLQGQSLFGERFGHFREEKRFIADHFVPILLRRCETLVESGKQVCLLIDSGTTLYPFFERLGQDTVRCYANREKWLEKFSIATNNLPGIESLMVAGRINPNNRYSPLAVECHLFPGAPLPIYVAITGEETNEALERLRAKKGSDAVFIGLTTGNWIRLRRSQPICPVPLARGIGHLKFKQTLVDNSDEIYVVTPLGKIFVAISQEEVNNALEFSPNHPNPDKQPYHEVQISDAKAISVKMVSTYRSEGHVLYGLSTRVRILLDVDHLVLDDAVERFPDTPVAEVPHILYRFDALPDDWYLQYEIEFPHEHTRREEFTRKFFFVRPAPRR